MSTTDAAPPRPAPRSLFTGLVDDAAVFPPGLAPVPDAVVRHRELTRGPYADLVGPLLVPVSETHRLRYTAAGSPAAGTLRVSLVARPGTPVREVLHALGELEGVPGLEVVSLELAHQPGWEEALGHGRPVVVEVPRDPFAQQRAMEELAGARAEHPVRAKFRTQGTPDTPVPTPAELATFVVRSIRRKTPFKLTGGLHHAVAGTHPAAGGGTEDQHGVLNVLLATRAALDGAEAGAVAEVLAVRDADRLVGEVASLTEEQARRLRAAFTSYGCCGVLDPLTELHDLHLI